MPHKTGMKWILCPLLIALLLCADTPFAQNRNDVALLLVLPSDDPMEEDDPAEQEKPAEPKDTPSEPDEIPSKPEETPSQPDETLSKPEETPSRPEEDESEPETSSAASETETGEEEASETSAYESEEELQSSEEDENITAESQSSEEEPPLDAEPEAPLIHQLSDPSALGNWTRYNGFIREQADLYESLSGGGLAVGGKIAFHEDFRIGSTHSSVYDPTLHIGEYKNTGGYPALLLAGKGLEVAPDKAPHEVIGGPIAMSPELLEYNEGLPAGLFPGVASSYLSADQEVLASWFTAQYRLATATSQLMLLGNDVSIELEELSSGEYRTEGPQRFRNQYFEVGGEVYENALFITVRSDSELHFGQWWPVFALLDIDARWAINHDLLVFNFPDAINVTMNASAFSIQNLEHWSTTVDAWIGESGMTARLALAEKVVYNFPAAQSIVANQALIQGTVLAPEATFTGIGFSDQGHIYGHIVAKNYIAQGNFNIHAFELTRWVYDIVADSVGKQQDTGELSLRHYLYFRGEPTQIRTAGGDFVLERAEGGFFDGKGGFVPSVDDAAVFTTQPEQYTLIENLPVGDYILVNNKAPEGFRINETSAENTATFYRHPVSIQSTDQTISVTRYSEPKFIDLHLQKTDSETGRGLPGAVFTLVREADGYQDATIGGTFTSGEEGYFSIYSLPVGSYQLLEMEPPEGYALLGQDGLRFQVVWDEDAERLRIRDMEGGALETTETSPLALPNTPGLSLHSLTVVKYEQDGDEAASHRPLPGAQLLLYRLDEAADAWTPVLTEAGGPLELLTNELGYTRIYDLSEGLYRIVESRAPPGFSLSNPYHDPDSESFPRGYAHEFSLSGEVSAYTVYLQGRALELDLTLLSRSLAGGESYALPGNSFQLDRLLADGKTWEMLHDSLRTDSEGEVLIEALPAGSYRLTELRAPTGHRPLSPAAVYFEISFDEDGAASVRAAHDGAPIDEGTSPVRLESAAGFRLTVEHVANLAALSVYKQDARMLVTGEGDHVITYLEGARLRLRRSTGTEEGWRDYGAAVRSEYLYDEGEPVRDTYGNHLAGADFAPGLLYGNYQLVEVESPEGYQTSHGTHVTFDDGETGYVLRLFTITESMAENGHASSYTVENHAVDQTMELRFRVVDHHNRELPLKGAQFALYHCEKDHVHDPDLNAGSCWAAGTPMIEESDARGLVVLDELYTGDYLLRESHAPDGYQLPNTLWRVTVSAESDTISIEATNGSTYDLDPVEDPQAPWRLPNRKQWFLPDAGGAGTAVFVAVGLALVAVAGLLLKFQLEKRKKR